MKIDKNEAHPQPLTSQNSLQVVECFRVHLSNETGLPYQGHQTPQPCRISREHRRAAAVIAVLPAIHVHRAFQLSEKPPGRQSQAKTHPCLKKALGSPRPDDSRSAA